MADSKITALGSIGTGTDPANDQLVIVDVSDVLPTGMATTGTTKRVGLNQLLSSSPTATGAFSVTGLVTAGSATITGAATVGTTLGVTGATTLAAASVSGDLTVRTNKLVVTSTGVGINTTPTVPFDLVGSAKILGTGVVLTLDKVGPAALQLNNNGNAGTQISSTTSGGFLVYTADGVGGGISQRHLIDGNGVVTWSNVGGVAGTAMTLSSTGLGIGVSPNFKFAVSGTQAVPAVSGSATDNGSCRVGASGTTVSIDSGVTAVSDVYAWIQARSNANYASNFPLIIQPNGGNVGLGTISFGTSASKVLSVGTGTEPTTGPAGTVQLFTSTRSASNTIPAIFCEGSGVTNAGITSTTVTNKIAIKVNGTIYYLLATTSAA